MVFETAIDYELLPCFRRSQPGDNSDSWVVITIFGFSRDWPRGVLFVPGHLGTVTDYVTVSVCFIVIASVQYTTIRFYYVYTMHVVVCTYACSLCMVRYLYTGSVPCIEVLLVYRCT